MHFHFIFYFAKNNPINFVIAMKFVNRINVLCAWKCSILVVSNSCFQGHRF